MKKPECSQAYIAALRDYALAMNRAIRRKSIANTATSSGHYSKKTTDTQESYVPEDTIISDSSIMAELSIRGLKMFARIIKELEFNNALWYFDHTKNKRDARVIAELREKKILYPTEDTRIHYVNPFLLRKGNILAVTANTAEVTKSSRVEQKMIKPLNKREIQVNPMHLAENNN